MTFMCYRCWIIAGNFGLHSAIIAIDCIYGQVGELEKERTFTGANFFEAGYTLHAFSGPVFISYRITSKNSTGPPSSDYTRKLFVPAQKPFQYGVKATSVVAKWSGHYDISPPSNRLCVPDRYVLAAKSPSSFS